MNKDEAVLEIRSHLMEIRRIVRELGCGDYLSLYVYDDGVIDSIRFFNAHYEGGAHCDDGLGIDHHERFWEPEP